MPGESVRDVISLVDPYGRMSNPLKANGLAGAKTLGFMSGNTIQMDSRDIYDVGRNFIYTEVGSGATAGVVQAPSATVPAVLQLTTGASLSNSQQLQWAKGQTASTTAAGTATAFAPFSIRAGTNGNGANSIHARFKIQLTSSATNASFFVGLANVNTALFGTHAPNLSNMTDAIGFYKAGGAATIAGYESAAGTATTTVLSANTIVISTWYTLDLYIKENLAATWWINGTRVGGDATGAANLPAGTVALCPSIVISAGTAAAATLQVAGTMVIQDGGF